MREIEALAGRIMNSDPAIGLRSLGVLSLVIRLVEDHQIQRGRDAGLTWQAIGRHLGISPQAAQQRYARSAPSVSDVSFDRRLADALQAREEVTMATPDGATTEEAQNPKVCSFCGKSEKQVRRLVSGPGVAICDGCVQLAGKFVENPAADRSCVECGRVYTEDWQYCPHCGRRLR